MTKLTFNKSILFATLIANCLHGKKVNNHYELKHVVFNDIAIHVKTIAILWKLTCKTAKNFINSALNKLCLSGKIDCNKIDDVNNYIINSNGISFLMQALNYDNKRMVNAIDNYLGVNSKPVNVDSKASNINSKPVKIHNEIKHLKDKIKCAEKLVEYNVKSYVFQIPVNFIDVLCELIGYYKLTTGVYLKAGQIAWRLICNYPLHFKKYSQIHVKSLVNSHVYKYSTIFKKNNLNQVELIK